MKTIPKEELKADSTKTEGLHLTSLNRALGLGFTFKYCDISIMPSSMPSAALHPWGDWQATSLRLPVPVWF